MSKEVALNNGKSTTVDDADYELVNQWKWRISNSGYAFRRKWVKTGKHRDERKNSSLYLHRFIMNVPPDMQVDHIDGNKLDNRRENLRVCTRSQNSANHFKRKGTSKYKGVSWNTQLGKWIVQTKFHSKPVWIGCFIDEIEAAKAYDKKLKELFGEFARTNFP